MEPSDPAEPERGERARPRSPGDLDEHRKPSRGVMPAAWGLGVLALTLAYASTLPRTVIGGDNPEFVTLFARGGVAHPSGYPLYVLWLRAMSWLPTSSPALGAAIATAALGVACLVALLLAARSWGSSASAALFAVGLFATAPRAWLAFTSAEVFAMHALFASLVLLVASPRSALRPERRAVLLGLLGGLALSNHLTSVALAPLGLGAAFASVRAARRPGRTTALAGLAFLVGLLPYVALPAGARGALVWGEPDTLAGFVRHVLRAEYGTLQLSAGAAGDPSRQLGLFAQTILEDGLGVGLGLALLFAAARARARATDGGAWALYGATWLLAGPALVSAFNLDVVGAGRFMISRFYLLPELLLVVPTALGVDTLLARARSSRLVVFAGLGAVVLARAGFTLPTVLQVNGPELQAHIENVLTTAPERSIVVTSGDTLSGGVAYMQLAHDARPDVTQVHMGLLGLPWYRERLALRMGLAPRALMRPVNSLELLARLAREGRSVVIANPSAAVEPLLRQLPSYPVGPTVRVLPPGSSVPTTEACEALNVDLYDRVFTLPTRPRVPDTWEADAYGTYALPWSTLERAFAAQGDAEGARRNAERAARFLADSTRPARAH